MENVSKRAELGFFNDFAGEPRGHGTVESCWNVVCTRSNYEHKVAQDFALKDIVHFLPGTLATRQWKDRKKRIFEPLFPGYLFTRFRADHGDRLEILKTPGVVRILSLGASPQPVPDGEIESIRRLLASGATYASHPFLKEGSWVRVRRGALAGVEGTLLRHRNSVRLIISVDVLSRSVATELDASDVEPARKAQSHPRASLRTAAN